MFLVSTQNHQGIAGNRESLLSSSSRLGSGAALSTLLSSPKGSSMERTAPEYSQTGLPSPYPSNYGDTKSEGSSADHASAAQYPAQQQSEVRSSNYSAAATPTSEYSVYPSSARSSTFPDHIQRTFHPASTHGASSGGMAQQQSSPSKNRQDSQAKSDSDVPLDSSIPAPSPTYPYPQHSPYAAPSQDIGHGYQHPPGGMYAHQRPEWGAYGGQHSAGPMTPAGHVFPPTPNSAPPQPRPNQVSRSANCGTTLYG